VEDVFGRIIGVSKDSVAADPAHGVPYDIPAIADATVYASNAEQTLFSETTVRVGGALQQTTSIIKDMAGRVVARQDAQGAMTTYVYDGADTLTYGPDGSLVASSRRYLDGQLWAEADARSGGRTYYRSVNADGTISTISHPLTEEGVWKMSVSSGSAVLQETSGGQTSSFFHLDNGRVRMIKRSGLADVLREYDALGRVVATGTDMNGNGLLDRAGADSLTETVTTYQQSEGTWWEVTREKRYVGESGDSDAQVREVWQKIDHSTGSTTKTIEPDGRIVWEVTTIDRDHGITTSRRSVMRGAVESEVSTRNYVAGLLVSETLPGLPVAITYQYDALRRRVKTVHPINGTTQWVYDENGQLTSTINSASQATTHSYYPATHASAGRLQATIHPDGTTTTYAYDAAGRVTLQAGSNGYRVARTYTAMGLPATLKTWRNFAEGDSSADTTIWNYIPYVGLLLSKTDSADRSVTYAYNDAALLQSRTWARGVSTSYSYNGDGKMVGIDYSDDTPDVTIVVDRLGRQKQITDGTGTRTLGYDCPCPQVSATEYDATSLLPNVSITFGHDAFNRRTSLDIEQAGGVLAHTAYSFTEDSNMLATVSMGGVTATYDWTTQVGGLPGTVSYSGAGFTGIRVPDSSGRLDSITWSVNNQVVSSTDYTLDAMGRRTAAAKEDGTSWAYDYNSKGEVTGASHAAGSSVLPGRSFGYAYDGIGNRTVATVATVNPPPAFTETSYTSNALNQYTTVQHPNPLRKVIQGLAHEQAEIEVTMANQSPSSNNPSSTNPTALTVARLSPAGQGFIAEPQVDTSNGPAWRFIDVKATRAGVGTNGQNVTTHRTGWLYFPPQSETLSYDDDGNLTEDARWRYTWDGENRLIGMQEKSGADFQFSESRPPLLKLTFTYDSQSRRIRKLVESRMPGSTTWSVTSDSRFLYDDWNLIAEFAVNPQTSSSTLHRSYAWGLDLSGTMQGAGGVGGLLLVRQHLSPALSLIPSPLSLAPAYDGNGNITAYVNVGTGMVTQRLEYDAFGSELSLESTLTSGAANASVSPFGFSTKFTDAETSLVYYGFRYYSPEMGRWPNRDPIGEQGGTNLHVMALNSLIDRWDLLGQTANGDALLAAALKAFFDNCGNRWDSPRFGNAMCTCTCSAWGDGCKEQTKTMLNNLNSYGPESHCYTAEHSGPLSDNFSPLPHNWVGATPTSPSGDPGASIDPWEGSIDIQETNGTIAHYEMTCNPKSVTVTYSYNMGPPTPPPPPADFYPGASY